MKLINLKCETCGARLKRSAIMRTLECEYCDSTYLAETTGQEVGLENETFVMPVELDENVATKNLLNIIKSSAFVHEGAENIISQIKPKGVMVPCYSFECELTSNWQGENSVDKVRQVWNPVIGAFVNEPYKEWYPQNGQHYGSHNAFVSASGALKESESWGLFPLPVEKKLTFSEGDENQKLSLEAPNMSPDEVWTTKGERVTRWMEEEACKTFVEKLKSVNSKIDKRKDSLIYTPVWIFNYNVDNIPYRNIVCAVTGRVVGEIPSNFDKLFEKLSVLKKEIDQKNTYFLIAAGATVILVITVAGIVFAFITGIAAFYFYQELNKRKQEFDTYVATNKYNLCYYILRQRKELKESLGPIAGLEMVEKCLDDEEGAKIDNLVAKQLVEKFVTVTKPKPEKKSLPGGKDDDSPTTTVIKLGSKGESSLVTQAATELAKACMCGQSIKEGWNVCPKCGTRVT